MSDQQERERRKQEFERERLELERIQVPERRKQEFERERLELERRKQEFERERLVRRSPIPTTMLTVESGSKPPQKICKFEPDCWNTDLEHNELYLHPFKQQELERAGLSEQPLTLGQLKRREKIEEEKKRQLKQNWWGSAEQQERSKELWMQRELIRQQEEQRKELFKARADGSIPWRQRAEPPARTEEEIVTFLKAIGSKSEPVSRHASEPVSRHASEHISVPPKSFVNSMGSEQQPIFKEKQVPQLERGDGGKAFWQEKYIKYKTKYNNLKNKLI